MSPPSLAILSVHTSPLTQPGIGDSGGMNVYIRSLGSALAKAGIECDVYTRADHPAQAPVVVVDPGFRVHRIPAGPQTAVPKEDLFPLVDEMAESIRTDIQRRERKHFAFHANYWISGGVAHALKHQLGIPMVTTFHTLARVNSSPVNGVDELRARSETSIVRCADLVFASTSGEVDQLTSLYDADPNLVEVVPPGVDHKIFTPGDRDAARRELGLAANRRVLLYVGRIQPLKGVDLAVRALAALDDATATLIVIGGPSGPDGPGEFESVRSLARDLGVADRVAWIPPRRHSDLVAYYRAADVCIVPSRSESFGLVALEAAACGTPVVASSVGGLRSVVTDQSTGFLIEGRDPDDYAKPISQLLSDGDLSSWMGLNATAASMRYSWTMTAARMRRLYSDLAARTLVECT